MGPAHDVAVAECRASWVENLAGRELAWELFRAAPSPVGYDPATIFPEGPAGAGAAVLRLDPWRLRAGRAAAMAAGEPALTWAA